MAISEVTLSKCSEHLSAYKSACENHPDLKSFDSTLQERTNKAIHSITAEAEKKTNIVKDLLIAKADKKRPHKKETDEAETELLLSQHKVHKEFSSHLHEVFQGVADFIVENKDDAWGKNLSSLVHAYLDSTHKTITILDKIDNCVEKADDGQRFILQAVAQFDKDSAEIDDVGGKKKKYEKTLDKLKKFKALEDPFSGHELITQFELVKKQQESLLEEVSKAIKKLQEEIDASSQQRRVIPFAIFGGVFVVTAIASIALLATGVGALAVTGIGLGLALPLTAIGWAAADTILARQMDALKKQAESLKELEKKYKSVGAGIEINKNAMESVSQHVHRLETKISDILKALDDAIEDEEDETDLRIDLNSIREKVKKLTQGMKEVGEAVSDARKSIDKARARVMEKISGSV